MKNYTTKTKHKKLTWVEKREIANKKYKGKILYDTQYKEIFEYENSRDWIVVTNYPERFIDIHQMKLTNRMQ